MNGSVMIRGLITISHISHLTHSALCSQSHLFVCLFVCVCKTSKFFHCFFGARERDSISLSIIILSCARRLSPHVASMWCDVYTYRHYGLHRIRLCMRYRYRQAYTHARIVLICTKRKKISAHSNNTQHLRYLQTKRTYHARVSHKTFFDKTKIITLIKCFAAKVLKKQKEAERKVSLFIGSSCIMLSWFFSRVLRRGEISLSQHQHRQQ